MNITKEQAIELAKEADKDLPRDDWNQIAFVLGEAALHRLCNLAVKHAAKDDDTALLRQALGALDIIYASTLPYREDGSSTISDESVRLSNKAITALRERLGDKT